MWSLCPWTHILVRGEKVSQQMWEFPGVKKMKQGEERVKNSRTGWIRSRCKGLSSPMRMWKKSVPGRPLSTEASLSRCVQGRAAERAG